MTTHLIHGFNVSDGGRNTVAKLAPHFDDAIVQSIGLVGLFDLRCKNKRIVNSLAPLIKPDDVLIGHSNGALIIYRLLQAGVRPKAVILFNAALRRDTEFPKDVPVLNLHCSNDWVVQLARVWSRLTSLGGITPHGWGSAGRYGLTNKADNVLNIDMGNKWYTHVVNGHSDALSDPVKCAYWAAFCRNWLSKVKE